MKILFISMFPLQYNTSASIRNQSLVNGLVKRGYKVDVLTLKPDSEYPAYDEKLFDDKDFKGRFFYINESKLYNLLKNKREPRRTVQENIKKENKLNKISKFLKRLIKEFFIFDINVLNLLMVNTLKINVSDYDIIISSSDPKTSHLLAKKIIKKTEVNWYQFWGDPMYHDITRNSSIFDSIIKISECNLLKKADKIIYTSPFTLSLQKSTFPENANKMIYANQIALKEENNCYRKKTSDKVKIGYFGAYNPSVRNIIPFYNYATKQNNFVYIAGESSCKLEEKDNLSIYRRLKFSEVVELEHEMDVLVVLLNLKGTQIPGKLYYNSGYNKPIVVIIDGESQDEILMLKEYLNSFKRYILCENNENSIRYAMDIALNSLNKKYELDERLKEDYFINKIINKEDI